MLEKSFIESIRLDAREGENSGSRPDVHEEKLQRREGKSGTRTVKQALAIDLLKARKSGDHLPE